MEIPTEIFIAVDDDSGKVLEKIRLWPSAILTFQETKLLLFYPVFAQCSRFWKRYNLEEAALFAYAVQRQNLKLFEIFKPKFPKVLF